VIRNLQTLAESSQRLSEGIKASQSSVDWKGLAARPVEIAATKSLWYRRRGLPECSAFSIMSRARTALAHKRSAENEREAMDRRDFVISAFACAVGLSTASRIVGQKKTIEPDLAERAEGKGLSVFNRSVSSLNDGARKGVRLSEHSGDGVAYLQGIEFTNGTIEFDVKGKDVQQQSFVGVAFHGVDGTTYDAIYFRPFNFRAEDPARRSRAVQYISHPTSTWQKLRAEQPGKYEQAVNPVPDPNAWFHVRVVVASPKVSVFVGDAKEPSLVVNQLSDRKKGLVGLWVGNNSGGDFADFRIVPA